MSETRKERTTQGSCIKLDTLRAADFLEVIMRSLKTYQNFLFSRAKDGGFYQLASVPQKSTEALRTLSLLNSGLCRPPLF